MKTLLNSTYKTSSFFKKSALLFSALILSASLSSSAQERVYADDAILTEPVNYAGVAEFLKTQNTASRSGAGASMVASPTLGAIQGPDTVCANQDTVSYSVSVTSIDGSPVRYYWFVPMDWQIISGQGTNTITVVAGAESGQVAVFAMGRCICHYSCKPVTSKECDDPITPLPVELISFEAARSQAGVLLKWSTAQELNNRMFEVQRSRDGRQFETIATIEGQGTTTSRTNYSYTDKLQTASKQALSSAIYYRLKQVDFSGKSELSAVRAVKATNMESAELSVYPNPAVDKITLENAQMLDEQSIITISSVTGQTVWSGSPRTLAASNNQINISHLKAGVYVASVKQTDGNNLSFRLVKN